MNYGHTQEPWVDFKLDSESGYVHGVRSVPGLICAMPGWAMHADLRAQQVANHKLILSAPDLLIERDQLKAINADLLAALQKLLTFPNKSHFNGESYAKEHGEVIGECLAAIASATKGGAA